MSWSVRRYRNPKIAGRKPINQGLSRLSGLLISDKTRGVRAETTSQNEERIAGGKRRCLPENPSNRRVEV